MLLEGEASTLILNELKGNVYNAQAWAALVETQTSPTIRLEVLEKAVATNPTSLSLRRTLIEELLLSHANAENNAKILTYLHDLLTVFPDQHDMWEILIRRFPSRDTFDAALKSAHKDLVWPHYVNFLLDPSSPLSDDERFAGLSEASKTPAQLKNIVSTAVASNLISIAERLTLCSGTADFSIWELVIPQSLNVEFLTRAKNLFPDKNSTETVIRLAQGLMQNEGNFTEARTLLLGSLENGSKVSAFPALFRATTALYEYAITHTSHCPGLARDSFPATRLISEYGNLIRKRPMLLSDTATREFPNNVQLWLDRAALCQARPHIAADVLETALRSIDPILAADTANSPSDISDLYIRYAELLIANGSSKDAVKLILEEASARPFITLNMRAKLYIALARLVKESEPDSALKALETALELQNLEQRHRQKVWLEYFTVLVDNRFDNAAAVDPGSSDKLLAAFSRACISRELTMRMALKVAKAFPTASPNQITVFEQAISLFPIPMVLPLWKQFLSCMNNMSSPARLRGLYSSALTSFKNDKKGYEELVLLYFEAERTWTSGSLLLARQRLVHTLHRTVNPRIWRAYIATLNDVTSQRETYEHAINLLDPKAAHQLALEFAALEADLGQLTRSNQIYEFARQIEQQYLQDDGESANLDDGTSMREVRFVPAMT